MAETGEPNLNAKQYHSAPDIDDNKPSIGRRVVDYFGLLDSEAQTPEEKLELAKNNLAYLLFKRGRGTFNFDAKKSDIEQSKEAFDRSLNEVIFYNSDTVARVISEEDEIERDRAFLETAEERLLERGFNIDNLTNEKIQNIIRVENIKSYKDEIDKYKQEHILDVINRQKELMKQRAEKHSKVTKFFTSKWQQWGAESENKTGLAKVFNKGNFKKFALGGGVGLFFGAIASPVIGALGLGAAGVGAWRVAKGAGTYKLNQLANEKTAAENTEVTSSQADIDAAIAEANQKAKRNRKNLGVIAVGSLVGAGVGYWLSNAFTLSGGNNDTARNLNARPTAPPVPSSVADVNVQPDSADNPPDARDSSARSKINSDSGLTAAQKELKQSLQAPFKVESGSGIIKELQQQHLMATGHKLPDADVWAQYRDLEHKFGDKIIDRIGTSSDVYVEGNEGKTTFYGISSPGKAVWSKNAQQYLLNKWQ